jgi:hypothetical protein
VLAAILELDVRSGSEVFLAEAALIRASTVLAGRVVVYGRKA